MLNIQQMLDDLKASPFHEIEVAAPHTGKISFPALKSGSPVSGVSGTFKEKPGTVVAHIEREGNRKPINSPQKGVIELINLDVAGKFVEAGTPLVRIRHYLTKEEVLGIILRQALSLFRAPERAAYYFVPEIDKNIKAKGSKTVLVRPGTELFIISRMKRESSLTYDGPEGIIYTVYFQPNKNVDAGEPLIGVCPENQLSHIQDVVSRVQTDWEEPD